MVLFRQSKCFPFVTEIGLAVLSSFLIYLSIPKVEWWLVAWIAFVPILIALKSAGHSNKALRYWPGMNNSPLSISRRQFIGSSSAFGVLATAGAGCATTDLLQSSKTKS